MGDTVLVVGRLVTTCVDGVGNAVIVGIGVIVGKSVIGGIGKALIVGNAVIVGTKVVGIGDDNGTPVVVEGTRVTGSAEANVGDPVVAALGMTSVETIVGTSVKVVGVEVCIGVETIVGEVTKDDGKKVVALDGVGVMGIVGDIVIPVTLKVGIKVIDEGELVVSGVVGLLVPVTDPEGTAVACDETGTVGVFVLLQSVGGTELMSHMPFRIQS
jgi:hypothetical protein